VKIILNVKMDITFLEDSNEKKINLNKNIDISFLNVIMVIIKNIKEIVIKVLCLKVYY
jgi:hypothetical protein